jgi:ADP-ribose pyrophosphatase YjhB (NUDIX family)
MKTFHPRQNETGQAVELKQPNQPSALVAWNNSNEIATATPNSSMPESLLGLNVASWTRAPTEAVGWEQLVTGISTDEPVMRLVTGKPPASGAVVIESDGRVWVVSPSNCFGGYTNTFPKGKLDSTDVLSLRANALKEVFEETGLQVELTGFLCDSERSTSLTRYYLARRVGGNPADMGWESQAVHLVPMSLLEKFTTHHNDQQILKMLMAMTLI